jgi:hypothetical protein
LVLVGTLIYFGILLLLKDPLAERFKQVLVQRF